MNEDQQKFLPLEGLRGVAAVIVLLGHLRLTLAAESSEFPVRLFGSPPWYISRPLDALWCACFDGNFAVWTFWILSGFVLSVKFFSQMRDGQSEKIMPSLLEAGLRRYPRLAIPVLFSIAFAWALHQAGFMTNRALASHFGHPYSDGWLGSFYAFEPNSLTAIKSGLWNTFFQYDGSLTYNAVYCGPCNRSCGAPSSCSRYLPCVDGLPSDFGYILWRPLLR